MVGRKSEIQEMQNLLNSSNSYTDSYTQTDVSTDFDNKTRQNE